MKIAFLGSRGIPARYSGFETFYEQLSVRLARRGHAVTVYNRAHFLRNAGREYHGVRTVSMPCVVTKHLETFSHTLLSTMHALFGRYDIVYYCIVGNSPLVWVPRLAGAGTLLNVDGSDWRREKWKGFARWYQRQCEWVATKTATVVISDARVIRQKYAELYGCDSIFVPYGANTERDDGCDALKKWNLAPDEYVLYVGRLVPENGADVLIDAFRQVKTDKRLVIVGDAPYSEEFKERLRRLADERVVFTGYAFGSDYAQLSCHAYLYVQPSGIDGTRPAVLDQLGFGNCVLVRNSGANTEVVADCGCAFDGDRMPASLAESLESLLTSPDKVRQFRVKAVSRIRDYYNWEWITDFHEDLFERLIRRRALISYDEFLTSREGQRGV